MFFAQKFGELDVCNQREKGINEVVFLLVGKFSELSRRSGETRETVTNETIDQSI